MPEPSPTSRSTRAGAGAVAGTSGPRRSSWLLGHFGVSLSAEAGSVIAGVVSTLALFVWHTGVRNILLGIWRGKGTFQPAS